MSDLFKCLNCSHKHDTTDWFENWVCDGDDFITECHQCEEGFVVVPRVEVSYEHPRSL